MVTKARSHWRLLVCCFTGSPVHDSDELDSTACQSSSSKPQQFSLTLCSNFRAKKKKGKKTVPVNHRQQQPIVTTAAAADITKDLPTQKKTTTICQVLSKCASLPQPALLCHVREQEPAKVRTGPSSTASLAQMKKKRRRFGESEQQMVVVLMLVVTLGTMLLGGRVLAIVCTSGWCYLSSYVKKDMSRARWLQSTQPRERRPMTYRVDP